MKKMTLIIALEVLLGTLAFGQTMPVGKIKMPQFSQAQIKDLKLKIQESKPKEIKHKEVQNSKNFTAKGNEGGGGADSAEDSKGSRRLLDLIEQDKLDYFTHLYDPNQDEIRKFLVRLHFVYFGRDVDIGNGNRPFGPCAEIPYKYWHVTGGNETFIKVLLKAYGFENKMIEVNYFGFCPYLNTHDKFQFGSISPATKELKWAFVDLPLESINDEGEVRILRPDTKTQLAIQKDGLVVISRKEFNQLDKESQAALFTHEALLYTVSVMNPDHIKKNGTSLIRAYNRQLLRFMREHDLLNITQFPIATESVIEAFQALEIPATKK